MSFWDALFGPNHDPDMDEVAEKYEEANKHFPGGRKVSHSVKSWVPSLSLPGPIWKSEKD